MGDLFHIYHLFFPQQVPSGATRAAEALARVFKNKELKMTLKVKKLLTHLLIGSTIFIGTPSFIESYFVPDISITRVIKAPLGQQVQYDRYLVSTKAGIFMNANSFFYPKSDLLDFQKDIKKLEGRCVKITKYGWRIKSTSEYENIIDVKELPDSSCPK